MYEVYIMKDRKKHLVDTCFSLKEAMKIMDAYWPQESFIVKYVEPPSNVLGENNV